VIFNVLKATTKPETGTQVGLFEDEIL